MQPKPPEAQAPTASGADEDGEATYDAPNDPPMSQRGPCERCKQSKVRDPGGCHCDGEGASAPCAGPKQSGESNRFEV